MKMLELRLFLSDLTEDARKKYFNFYGANKEKMYKKLPENACYVATCYKFDEIDEETMKELEQEITEISDEEKLAYTD